VGNHLCVSSGMDHIDPKELESMRHQLEDAQRWNASLQARLGAIQNRGGGVGGANDGGTTRINTQILHSNVSSSSFSRWDPFCDHNIFFCASGDTLSFIGDQTSYMSICVGEEQDDSLSLLSPQELKQKVNSFSNS